MCKLPPADNSGRLRSHSRMERCWNSDAIPTSSDSSAHLRYRTMYPFQPVTTCSMTTSCHTRQTPQEDLRLTPNWTVETSTAAENRPIRRVERFASDIEWLQRFLMSATTSGYPSQTSKPICWRCG